MKYLVIILLLFGGIVSSCRPNVVYVSSSVGSDKNSGLSPEEPLRTISYALTKADTVLLKSGDVFYETIVVKRGLVSKYGGKAKPTLSGYKRIKDQKWESVGNNVWRISLAENNYSGFDTKGTSMLNNIGCVHEFDKDLIHGRKHQFKSQLEANWDIWQTEHHDKDETTGSDFDSLYLYLNTDPNKLKLEFSIGGVAATVSNATLEAIRFEGFGFGISAGTRITIRNCEIDAIGGKTQLSSPYICYGNGIEFWIKDDLSDCLVESNKITRCYDCACTIQGRNGSPRNILFRKNVIIDCCQGWEDFFTNENADLKFDNCVFEENIVVNSGNTTGFGYANNRTKFCHVLGNNYLGNRGMIFRNNTFIGGNFLCAAKYDGAFKSNVWEGNTCIIERGDWLLRCVNKGSEIIIIPTEKGKFHSLDTATDDAIRHYRDLTGDQTTKFIIKGKRSMSRMVNRLKNKYL